MSIETSSETLTLPPPQDPTPTPRKAPAGEAQDVTPTPAGTPEVAPVGEQGTPGTQQDAPEDNQADGTPTLESTVAELTAKYTKEGKLEDADITALEAFGLPRSIIESYIANTAAVQEKSEEKLLSAIGGREVFDTVSKWAQENLTEADINEFNDAVASDNEAVAKIALKGLKAQYDLANGFDGKNVGRQANPQSNSSNVFQSSAEQNAAIGDPRYKRGDVEYQLQVQAKMIATEEARRSGRLPHWR